MLAFKIALHRAGKLCAFEGYSITRTRSPEPRRTVGHDTKRARLGRGAQRAWYSDSKPTYRKPTMNSTRNGMLVQAPVYAAIPIVNTK